MIFLRPVPFREAAESQAVKTVLPTTLNSAELRQLGTEFHRRAFVISKVENARVLDAAHQTVRDILDGKQSVTYGRLALQDLIKDLKGEGTPEELVTRRRMDVSSASGDSKVRRQPGLQK